VKPTPKAVNKPSPHFIVHGLDKPGGFTTVSHFAALALKGVAPRNYRKNPKSAQAKDLRHKIAA
jgi:hypothetical protein